MYGNQISFQFIGGKLCSLGVILDTHVYNLHVNKGSQWAVLKATVVKGPLPRQIFLFNAQTTHIVDSSLKRGIISASE